MVQEVVGKCNIGFATMLVYSMNHHCHFRQLNYCYDLKFLENLMTWRSLLEHPNKYGYINKIVWLVYDLYRYLQVLTSNACLHFVLNEMYCKKN